MVSFARHHIMLLRCPADEAWLEELARVFSPDSYQGTTSYRMLEDQNPEHHTVATTARSFRLFHVIVILASRNLLAVSKADARLKLVLEAAEQMGIPIFTMRLDSLNLAETPLAAVTCAHDARLSLETLHVDQLREVLDEARERVLAASSVQQGLK